MPDQALQPREECVRRGGGGERRQQPEALAPLADGQRPEERPLPRGEEVVAPADRAGEGLLTRGAIGRGPGQEVQAVAEPREQRRRGQHAQPRSRQFERQRQAVEAATEGRDVGGVAGRDRERGVARRHAPHEEGDRRRARDGVRRGIVRREGERGHRVRPLAAQPERRPACHQHGQLRAGVQQRRERPRRRQEVLEIIEAEEERPPAQRPAQAPLAHPQRPRDRRQELGRVGEGGQRHERDAVRVVRGQRGGDGQREAGLADAARPGDGQQPRSPPAYRRDERGDIVRAPDQRRGGARQRRDEQGGARGAGRGGMRRCRRRLEAPPCGGIEPEGVQQQVQRRRLRARLQPALQIADRARAQRGALRQRLLRQRGGGAGLPQERAESHRVQGRRRGGGSRCAGRAGLLPSSIHGGCSSRVAAAAEREVRGP